MTFAIQACAKDLLDKLDYSIGDEYKTVVSRIDFSDPNDCRTKLDSPFFPIAIQSKASIDYRIKRVTDPQSQKVLKIIRSVVLDDCSIERTEVMDFCLSTGELVHHQITIPINQNDKLRRFSMFDKDEIEFIGFGENEKLIQHNFEGEMFVSFHVLNTEKGYLRESLMSHSNFETKVVHQLYRAPKDYIGYTTLDLCPEGPDIISDYRPRFTGLDSIVNTATNLFFNYSKTERMFKTCVEKFPQNKIIYDAFMDEFERLNGDDFELVGSKVAYILPLSEDKEIYSEYMQTLNQYKKLIDHLVKDVAEEQCDNVLSEPKHLSEAFGSDIDIDLVRNTAIE